MQTKIYLACVRPLQEKALFERFYAEASPKRKEKICRYRYEKDRLLSLGADALLRYALRQAGLVKVEAGFCRDTGDGAETASECAEQGTEEPVLAYGENGKPYFPELPDFHFNLAHAGEHVMLAVSDREIGCDIEPIRPVDLKLPRHAFHPLEYAHIAVCPEEERDELFFRYWVLKESYIKALGTGLSQGLSSFRILLEEPIRVLQDGEPRDLSFLEGGDISGCRYAACIKGALPEIRKEIVDLRKVNTGQDDRLGSF